MLAMIMLTLTLYVAAVIFMYNEVCIRDVS